MDDMIIPEKDPEEKNIDCGHIASFPNVYYTSNLYRFISVGFNMVLPRILRFSAPCTGVYSMNYS